MSLLMRKKSMPKTTTIPPSSSLQSSPPYPSPPLSTPAAPAPLRPPPRALTLTPLLLLPQHPPASHSPEPIQRSPRHPRPHASHPPCPSFLPDPPSFTHAIPPVGPAWPLPKHAPFTFSRSPLRCLMIFPPRFSASELLRPIRKSPPLTLPRWSHRAILTLPIIACVPLQRTACGGPLSLRRYRRLCV